MATTTTGGAYSMIPAELVPVFKNHASLPMIGTGESLEEIVNNYKYPNPYECRVKVGTGADEPSNEYYVENLGLPGDGWWFIKYFPFDSTGNGTQLAIPLGVGQSPKYRGSTQTGWTAWSSLVANGSTKSYSFTLSKNDWHELQTAVGGYKYYADIKDRNITSSMDASVIIDQDYIPVAQQAYMSPSAKVYDGYIRVFAMKSINAIQGSYLLYNA